MDEWLVAAQKQYKIENLEGYGEVEYRKFGSAPFLVYFHGQPEGYFAHESLCKAAGYGCITMSRPGYFRTPLRYNTTRPAEQAKVMGALLDKLGVEGGLLANGMSGGGPAAIQFAAQNREKVIGLMLDSAVSAMVPAEKFVPNPLKNRWGMVGDLIWPLDVATWISWQIRLALKAEEPPESELPLHRQMFKEYIKRAIKVYEFQDSWNPGAQNDEIQYTTNIELSQAPLRLIHEAGCPTLISHARDDEAVPFWNAENAAQIISEAPPLHAAVKP